VRQHGTSALADGFFPTEKNRARERAQARVVKRRLDLLGLTARDWWRFKPIPGSFWKIELTHLRSLAKTNHLISGQMNAFRPVHNGLQRSPKAGL
jgi:hypothetical protein